jgi:hypothetical protein
LLFGVVAGFIADNNHRTRQSLCRHIGPDGALRQDGQKMLAR